MNTWTRSETGTQLHAIDVVSNMSFQGGYWVINLRALCGRSVYSLSEPLRTWQDALGTEGIKGTCDECSVCVENREFYARIRAKRIPKPNDE
jgi:hypothetical protein